MSDDPYEDDDLVSCDWRDSVCVAADAAIQMDRFARPASTPSENGAGE